MFHSLPMHSRAFFALLLVFFGLYLGLPQTSEALTAAESAALRAMGINPDNASLVRQLSGGCDSNPYQQLEQYKSGNVQITPQAGAQGGSATQGGINSVLACRLLKFFQYAQQNRGCQFRIISAYRSAQHQQSICGAGRPGCAPPGTSCHQYGLAVDISASAQCMSWARQFLGQRSATPGAQQFKLHFPYSGPHLQCSENAVAACNASTRGCDGSGNTVSPGPPGTQPPPGTGQRPPTSGPLGGLGSMFQPPPPQQCPPGTMMMNGSCMPQQQAMTNNPYNYLQPQSTETSSPLLTSSSTNLNTNTNYNSNFDTGYLNSASSLLNESSTGSTDSGTTTSIADLLNSLAYGTPSTSATQTASGTPTVLNSSLTNEVTLSGQQYHNAPTATSTYVLNPVPHQTFVSQDLSRTPPVNQYTSTASTFSILENLRKILLTVMQLLQPFGGTVPNTADTHE
jgi:hypothetical protein